MRDEPAEVRSTQGVALARGEVSGTDEGPLEFRPARTPTALIRYFFLSGQREACLAVRDEAPLPVRLETRWADGRRRWRLLPT